MNQPSSFDYTLLPMPEMIKPVPEWNLLDPSKLNTLEECPRRFFYEYLLGWREDRVNKHFVFGSAWHLAMEYISWNGFSPESLNQAYKLFLNYYRSYFGEETDLDNAPKNPANAKLALFEYAALYGERDTRDYKTLHTELFVRVPINNSGRLMVGRLDKIRKHYERGIEGADYKTSTKRTNSVDIEWKLSLQMNFYYHVLKIAYPGENIFGIMVDIVYFYKRQQANEVTKNIPIRIPIRKENDMHQAFLSDLNTVVDFLDWNMEGLSKSSPDDVVLSAFPRRTKSCVNRYGYLCPFSSLCMGWSNPLKFCSEPPLDFKVEHWNPRTPDEKPEPKETFDPTEGWKKND